MKILSITAQKPHSTGSGTYMTELVKSFARAGHEQAVVCGIYPSDEIGFPEGVYVYPVYFTESPAKEAGASGSDLRDADGIRRLPFPITGMSDIMPYTSTRYRDLTPDMIGQFEGAFIGAVSKAVDELDPDLIICHHLFLLTALVRKHFPEKKIAGISHGTDLRQMKNCEMLSELVRPWIAELDIALALHDEQRRTITEIFGMPESRTAVIGSGYNDSVFNRSGRVERAEDEPVRICYAGKVSRPKGVPEMLAAIAELSEDPSVPDLRLTMAGGCQDEALKDSLADLPSYVSYLGQIPQNELAALLKRSDIFVLPSYFEGLPLVLIEAMASGALPVSTDLPGVRGWIDSNVKDPSVRYVPMPGMKSIDEPTDAGRAAFTADLADVIRRAVLDVYQKKQIAEPDTSGITWDSVAEKVLSF